MVSTIFKIILIAIQIKIFKNTFLYQGGLLGVLDKLKIFANKKEA